MPESKRLDLESYMLLCDYPDQLNLFVKNQLEDVIFMHGFNRIPSLKKSEHEQDVAALELMHAPRSTVNEIVSPSDSYSVDEITRDLDLIGWKECPITSVKEFGTSISSDDSVPVACSVNAACNSDSGITTVSSSMKKKKKRKLGEKQDKAGPDNPKVIQLKKKSNKKADEN